MDIQQKKPELVKLIIETGESDLLDVVEMILQGKNKEDWWSKLSEAEKRSIEQGLEEADHGETIPHEQVMKEVKEKYNLK